MQQTITQQIKHYLYKNIISVIAFKTHENVAMNMLHYQDQIKCYQITKNIIVFSCTCVGLLNEYLT